MGHATSKQTAFPTTWEGKLKKEKTVKSVIGFV
jgi:hypothetical protein